MYLHCVLSWAVLQKSNGFHYKDWLQDYTDKQHTFTVISLEKNVWTNQNIIYYIAFKVLKDVAMIQ